MQGLTLSSCVNLVIALLAFPSGSEARPRHGIQPTEYCTDREALPFGGETQ